MIERHEVLFIQLETYRKELLWVVENVTAEEAEMIPEGFRNNIRWNLGHVFVDQYLWIQAVTKESVPIPPNFSNWFGFGSSPKDFTKNTPSLSQLKVLLKEQTQNIKKSYGDKLDVEYTAIEMHMNTIEQVLIRTIFHEGMHLQVILDLLKCIRK